VDEREAGALAPAPFATESAREDEPPGRFVYRGPSTGTSLRRSPADGPALPRPASDHPPPADVSSIGIGYISATLCVGRSVGSSSSLP